MAQRKYELITVDTKYKGPKRHFPWYKERLDLKFLKSKQSAVYDGVSWTFIPRGTDDFRTGIPCNTTGALLRQRSNPVPLIGTAGMRRTRIRDSRMDGDSTLFSKEGPQRQMRREYIQAVELGLLKHPIGIYPHLTEAIPAEMVDDVVHILDPALIKEDITATVSEVSLSKEMPQQSLESSTPSASSSVQKSEGQENCRPFIYKFPLMKTAKEREREKDLLVSQQVISAKQQSRVNEVTRDLVQWGEQLGGTDDPVDEHMIRNLFGSDYETKPISMAPIQVVELDSVPNDLRTDRVTSQQSEKRKALYHYYGYQRVGCRGDMAFLDDIGEHRVVKTKYGAWYLPASLWKLRHWDEPLRDPAVVAADDASRQGKRQQELDDNLSELHGARAFKEFILTKKTGVAMPAFLKSVELNPDWMNRKF